MVVSAQFYKSTPLSKKACKIQTPRVLAGFVFMYGEGSDIDIVETTHIECVYCISFGINTTTKRRRTTYFKKYTKKLPRSEACNVI